MASTEESTYVLFDKVVPDIAFQNMSYVDKVTDSMKVECQMNPKCFTVSFYIQPFGIACDPYVYTHYFCQHHIVTHFRNSHSDTNSIRAHTLPLEVLMTIKHFQVSQDPYFNTGFDMYNKHPEYFRDHDHVQVMEHPFDQRIQTLQEKLDEEEMKTALEKIALDKKSIEKGRNRLVELRDAIELERQDLVIDKIEFVKKKQQHEIEHLKMREEHTELEKDRDYYRDIVESIRKDLYALFPSDSSL